MKPMVRVLCVDDNPLVGEALRAALARSDGLTCVGWRPTADDLAGTAAALGADVVLLDADMPGRDPFAAMEELLSVAPSIRVVVVSGLVHPAVIDRAIAAGAWGYISKADGEAAVLAAVRCVMAGEFCLSPEARQMV